jgi:hypothetical protein
MHTTWKRHNETPWVAKESKLPFSKVENRKVNQELSMGLYQKRRES